MKRPHFFSVWTCQPNGLIYFHVSNIFHSITIDLIKNPFSKMPHLYIKFSYRPSLRSGDQNSLQTRTNIWFIMTWKSSRTNLSSKLKSWISQYWFTDQKINVQNKLLCFYNPRLIPYNYVIIYLLITSVCWIQLAVDSRRHIQRRMEVFWFGLIGMLINLRRLMKTAFRW